MYRNMKICICQISGGRPAVGHIDCLTYLTVSILKCFVICIFRRKYLLLKRDFRLLLKVGTRISGSNNREFPDSVPFLLPVS